MSAPAPPAKTSPKHPRDDEKEDTRLASPRPSFKRTESEARVYPPSDDEKEVSQKKKKKDDEDGDESEGSAGEDKDVSKKDDKDDEEIESEEDGVDDEEEEVVFASEACTSFKKVSKKKAHVFVTRLFVNDGMDMDQTISFYAFPVEQLTKAEFESFGAWADFGDGCYERPFPGVEYPDPLPANATAKQKRDHAGAVKDAKQYKLFKRMEAVLKRASPVDLSYIEGLKIKTACLLTTS